jgi:transcriptional regulator with XRE-family HTH domain
MGNTIPTPANFRQGKVVNSAARGSPIKGRKRFKKSLHANSNECLLCPALSVVSVRSCQLANKVALYATRSRRFPALRTISKDADTVTKSVNQLPRVVGARLPIERARDAKCAKRLRQLLSEREMTQSDLAAKIWDRHTNSEGKYVAKGRDRISVWVNGKNFPDRENLQKLAQALKVKVSDLAPEAELKAAHSVPADWSMTKLHGEEGVSFFQAARYLPDDIAHEIVGLLIKADRSLKGAGKSRGQKDNNDD